jgi:uracil phosphoribosyltransferase
LLATDQFFSEDFVMDGVTIVDHPLVQHKLTLLRDKTRSTKVFRELFNEIGALLCYEVTRDLPLANVEVETPLAKMQSPKLAGKKLVLAPVGRAGSGFLEGMLNLLPSARVAHIGIYRDPRTLTSVEYFFKAPDDMPERLALVLHPMLATGNSAVAAVDRLKEAGARTVRIACLLATRQAIEKVRANHPDVHIWTAAIDDAINEAGYILPGLGDVGDRMFGTR